jgi:hypothetical protein
MSDKPISLDAQVVARVRQFLQSTNVSQRKLAAAVGSDPGNFSAFLAGAKSLPVTKMAKLLQILGLNRMQLEAKFSGSAVIRISVASHASTSLEKALCQVVDESA